MKKLQSSFCSLIAVLTSGYSFSLPQEHHVVAGEIEINHSENQMNVHQSTDKGIIEFDDFSIAQGQRVIFNQPNESSVTLNRVIGVNASDIFGDIQANGKVFLVNPNGVFFSESSQVDVGALVVSTQDISNENFLSEHFLFTGNADGKIVNNGTILSGKKGYIVFIADEITNEGALTSQHGNIGLTTGQSVVVSFEDEMVGFDVTEYATQSQIDNAGTISAEGNIRIEAASYNAIEDTVINNTGIIQASGMEVVDGEIIISSTSGGIVNEGIITNSGSVNNEEKKIHLSSGRIANYGEVNSDSLSSGNGGDIQLYATDAIYLAPESIISANASERGNGGNVIVFSENAAMFGTNANISVTGGSLQGDGGFAEVSGALYVAIDGKVDTTAQNGDNGLFYIDPTDITIVAGTTETNGNFNGGGPWDWLPNGGGSSIIGASRINTLLAAGNDVTIDTASADTGGDTGVMNIDADINLDGVAGQTLTLRANILLSINADICDIDLGSCQATPDGFANIVLDTTTNASGGSILFSSAAEIDTGGGTLDIFSDNGITIGSAATTQSRAGATTMTASGIIDFGDGVQIESEGGAIAISSVANVNADNGVSTGARFDTAGGSLSISGTSGIDLNQSTISGNPDVLLLNSIAGPVVLPDAGGISTTGDLFIRATDVSEVSSRSIGIAADTFNFASALTGGAISISSNVNNLDFSYTGTDTIAYNEANGLTIDSLSLGGGVFDLNAANDIIVSGLNLNGSTGSFIDLESTGGSLNITGDILDSNLGSTDTISFRFAASSDINVVNDVDILSYGSDITLFASGNIVKGTSSDIYSGSGRVILQGNSLTLRGTTRSDSTAANAIDLTSASFIQDGSASTAVDVEATSGGIVFSAVTGIDLDINTALLDVTNTTSGTVFISEVDDLTITNVDVPIGITIRNTSGSINFDNGSLVNYDDISLFAVAGNIVLPDTGLSTTGNVVLSANDVLDNTDRTLSITSNTFSLTTAQAAGDTQFNTDMNTLFASTSGANTLSILDTGSFDVAGLSSGGGDINLQASDSFDITNAVNLDGANGATFDFRTTTGDISISANITDGSTASTDAVNFTLNSGNDIIIDTSIQWRTYGGNYSATATNEFSKRASSDLLTQTGTIFIQGNRVDVRGNSISTNTTNSAVSVVSNTNIRDGGGTENDLEAPNGRITLSAVTGIDIDTNADSIDITNTTSGSVVITEEDDMTIVNLSAPNVTAIESTGGSLTFMNGSIASIDDLTLDAATGTVTLPDTGFTTAGNIIIRSDDIDDNSDRGVSISSSSLLIETAATGGDLAINTTVADIDLTNNGTSQISINETDNLSLSNLVNTSGTAVFNVSDTLTIPDIGINIAGDLVLLADHINDSDSDLNITAGQLTLASNWSGGNSTVSGDVDNLSINNNGLNTIVFMDSDTLSLDELSSTGGNVEIETVNDLTVTNTIDLDGANGASLTFRSTSGNINLDQNITDSNSASTDAVAMNFISGNNTTIANGRLIQSYGGNIDIDATNNFNIINGAELNSGDGTLTIDANDVDLIGELVSLSNSNNAVVINSNNSIAHGGMDFIDISAFNGGVVLNAQTGIDLDTDTTQISLTNTTSGDIAVTDSNDLLITNLNSVGNANIDSTTGSLSFSTGAIANVVDLGLTATAGNIIFPDENITVSGDITLNADDIFDADDNISLTADQLSLTSNWTSGSILFSTTVNGVIVNNTGANNVVILDSDDLNVNGVTLSGGGAADVGATDTLTLVNAIDLDGANNSSIILRSNAGILNVNESIADSDTATSDAVNIVYAAGTDINIADDQISESSGGNIALQAGNNINVGSNASLDSGSGIIIVNANAVSVIGRMISDSALANAIQIVSNTSITEGGAASVNLRAVNGGIELDAQTGVDIDTNTTALSVVNSTSGDIVIDEEDDLTISDINAAGHTTITSLSGNLNLTGYTAINDLSLNASSGEISIPSTGITSTGTISLNANDIYDDDRTINLNADTLNVVISLLGGALTVNSDVNFLSLNHTGNSNTFSISDAGSYEVTSLLLNGADVSLSANNNIDFNTLIDLDNANGSTLFVQSTVGNITLGNNFLDSNIGTQDSVSFDFNAGGNIELTDAVKLNSYGGNVSLVATGDVLKRWTSDVVADNGTVYIQGNSVLLRGFVISDNTAANAIEVVSATNIVDAGGATNDLEATTGGIILSAQTGIDIETNAATLSVSNSTSGDVLITEEDNVVVTDINTVGLSTIESTTGNIEITGATSVEDLTVSALMGNIILPDAGITVTGDLILNGLDIGDADRNLMINANSLTIVSGFSGGDVNINSDINTLSITHSGTDSIALLDADTFDLQMLSLASGELDLGAVNTISLNQMVDLNGANGALFTLRSVNGDLNINADISDTDNTVADSVQLNFLAGNNFNLQSGNSIQSNGGSINIVSVGASTLNSSTTINSSVGDVSINADGVDINGVINSDNTSNSAISIVSSSSVTDDGTNNIELTASSGGVVLSAENGIDIDLSINVLDIENNTSGNIDISNNSDLSIANFASAGSADLNVSGNNLTLPDAGLVASNTESLIISAADIFDATGRNLHIDAGNLFLNLTNLSQDTTFNTTVNAISIDYLGSGNLRILENDNLTVSSLNISNGNQVLIDAQDISVAGDGVFFNDSSVGGLALNASGSISIVNDFSNMGGAGGHSIDLSIDAQNSIQIDDGVLVDVGGGVIAINTSNGDVDITGLSSNSSSSSAISITSGGQINQSGNTLTAVFAANGGAVLQAQNGINDITMDVSSIDITNSATGNVRIDELNDVTVTGVNVVNNFSLITPGSIVIPDAGLLAPGQIELRGNSLTNAAGTALDFTADQILLETQGVDQGLNLQLISNSADISISNSGDLNILSNSTISLTDLDGNGQAILVNDGDLDFNAVNGGLSIDADIIAQDLTDDDIQSGLISFLIQNGDLTIGDNQPVQILSDSRTDVGAGITNPHSENATIYIANTNAENRNTVFNLGDGMGDDVLIESLAGDVVIDVLGTNINADSQVITLANDVTIRAKNSITDLNTGTLFAFGVDTSRAMLEIGSDRSAYLVADTAIIVGDEPNPEVPEDIVTDTYPKEEDEVVADNPVDGDIEDPSQIPQSVERVLGYGSAPCSDDLDASARKKCNIDQAYYRFLSSFLISGQLPSINREDLEK